MAKKVGKNENRPDGHRDGFHFYRESRNFPKRDLLSFPSFSSVIPAQAGIQISPYDSWIPVSTGMTRVEFRNSQFYIVKEKKKLTSEVSYEVRGDPNRKK